MQNSLIPYAGNTSCSEVLTVRIKVAEYVIKTDSYIPDSSHKKMGIVLPPTCTSAALFAMPENVFCASLKGKF